MSYIEKEKLIKADIASIENRVRHAFNQGYDLGFKDGKEKARPQESIKPVLEYIKAEIKRKANSGQWSDATVYGMQKAIAIIDKHISGK